VLHLYILPSSVPTKKIRQSVGWNVMVVPHPVK
jgi:hypothetical protein